MPHGFRVVLEHRPEKRVHDYVLLILCAGPARHLSGHESHAGVEMSARKDSTLVSRHALSSEESKVMIGEYIPGVRTLVEGHEGRRSAPCTGKTLSK